MKRSLLMAGFLSLIIGFFSPSSRAVDYQVAEVYSGLRNMIFSITPDSIGVKLKEPGEVWGVVMETGYPKAVATLVALADGTVSLYFSNGGGLIGPGPQAGPQRAGQTFLSFVQKFFTQLQPTRRNPFAKPSNKPF